MSRRRTRAASLYPDLFVSGHARWNAWDLSTKLSFFSLILSSQAAFKRSSLRAGTHCANERARRDVIPIASSPLAVF
jgi:hypothetical protein